MTTDPYTAPYADLGKTIRDAERAALLETLEQTRDAVALVTGLRQQFIDQGWTEQQAGDLVVAMLGGALKGSHS
ncbi:hypothetical protein K8F61_18620 [Microbacterium resistens]|uniref:Uncharacterized protein n=1 Tax=Microbacterium resistens TaxID=156977 RepID=A0ABY3RUF6_9MICO|nr:hypothetical protein [Microbacterium resistens]UGS26600.1 hypothetical protein K8F61_18620 [Microbacterium resistens]